MLTFHPENPWKDVKRDRKRAEEELHRQIRELEETNRDLKKKLEDNKS